MAINYEAALAFMFEHGKEFFMGLMKDVGLTDEQLNEVWENQDWNGVMVLDLDIWEKGRDRSVQAQQEHLKAIGEVKDSTEKVDTIQNLFIVDTVNEKVVKSFRYVSRQGLARTKWMLDQLNKLETVATYLNKTQGEHHLFQVTQKGVDFSGTLPAIIAYADYQEEIEAEDAIVPPRTESKKKNSDDS